MVGIFVTRVIFYLLEFTTPIANDNLFFTFYFDVIFLNHAFEKIHAFANCRY